MIAFKDIFKPSFFTLLVGVLIVGYLLGYSFGSNKLLQSNTTYVQTEIGDNHIEKNPVQTTSSSIITIQKGDTLWKIAQDYFPNYPIDDVIHYLKTLNQLESDSIQAGEKLRLS